MKYCNNNECKWNDRHGTCTSFAFEDDEDDNTRECMKNKNNDDSSSLENKQ